MGDTERSKGKFNPLWVVMREINSAKQRKCKSVRVGPTQMRLHEGEPASTSLQRGEPDEIDSLFQALVERGYGVSVHVSDEYPSPNILVSWK